MYIFEKFAPEFTPSIVRKIQQEKQFEWPQVMVFHFCPLSSPFTYYLFNNSANREELFFVFHLYIYIWCCSLLSQTHLLSILYDRGIRKEQIIELMSSYPLVYLDSILSLLLLLLLYIFFVSVVYISVVCVCVWWMGVQQPKMIELLHFLHQHNCEIKILSDSNMIFIETILKSSNVAHLFSEIITNSAHFDEKGRLIIGSYHNPQNPHDCQSCSTNLCKGLTTQKECFCHISLSYSMLLQMIWCRHSGFKICEEW
jgi:hypothetical protein